MNQKAIQKMHPETRQVFILGVLLLTLLGIYSNSIFAGGNTATNLQALERPTENVKETALLSLVDNHKIF